MVGSLCQNVNRSRLPCIPTLLISDEVIRIWDGGLGISIGSLPDMKLSPLKLDVFIFTKGRSQRKICYKWTPR